MTKETIKVGMLSFAHVHAPAYARLLTAMPDVEFIGIADEDQERGAAAARLFHCDYFATHDELLAAAGLAAVVICAPNSQHRELAVAAARAGKHILCEKPLATTIADGEAMIAACQNAGVQLMTAFPMRFSAPAIALRGMVRDGAIGDILAARTTNHGTLPPGWFSDPRLSGGGAVMDHTVHVADLLRWILGREFTSVYAEVDTLLHPGLAVDDAAMLLLEMDGGVFASLDPSWSRPKSYPTWGDVTMELIGTRGVLSLDAFAQKIEVFSDESGRARWESYAGGGDPDMLRAFIDAIRAGTCVPVTGLDGLRATAVALAAYTSARTRAVAPLRGA